MRRPQKGRLKYACTIAQIWSCDVWTWRNCLSKGPLAYFSVLPLPLVDSQISIYFSPLFSSVGLPKPWNFLKRIVLWDLGNVKTCIVGASLLFGSLCAKSQPAAPKAKKEHGIWRTGVSFPFSLPLHLLPQCNSLHVVAPTIQFFTFPPRN